MLLPRLIDEPIGGDGAKRLIHLPQSVTIEWRTHE